MNDEFIQQYEATIKSMAGQFNARTPANLTFSDFVQAGYIATWKAMGNSKANNRSYVIRCAKNGMFDVIRNEMKFNWLEPSGTMEDHVIDIDAREIFVMRAVDRLSDIQKEVIGLIYWQGYSVEEAARSMSCSGTKVRGLHRKALRRLRMVLKVGFTPGHQH